MRDIPPDILIETRALRRVHRMGGHEIDALKGVDLTIRRGEFVAVMGPSGSGKTTLMNIIGCLDRPTSGRCRLAGRDVAGLDRDALADIRNRGIGFVFQSYNLLPRTSAMENVELPMIYAGAPAARRRERARALLERVGLAGRERHEPSQLSGGQQQRVAIARALANDPALILADEPTGALDTRSGLEVMAILQDLNRQGITVVIVTHEAEIARFAGRRLTFRDGRLVDDRATEALNAGLALADHAKEAA